MPKFIINLAVQILRKAKCSVIIGYEVGGDLKAKYNVQRAYDSTFGGRYLLPIGEEFRVPQGKFSYSYENPKQA